MPSSETLTPDSLGQLCLHHLAEQPSQLAEFMSITGFSPDTLRAGLGGDGLNHGLIDYFATNEALLLALCANTGIRPEDFMRVWARINPSG